MMRLYDYPLSDEFTSFVISLKKRVDELIDEIAQAKQELLLENALYEIKQRELYLRLNKLENDIEALDAMRSGNIVIIREPFADDKSFDLSAVSKEPAEIVTANNMLTLKRTSATELQVSSVRITSGNGFPGNLHTVYEGSNIYHARDGMHISLKDIIDGNNDTWFEYEKLRGIPGYKYKNAYFNEGVFWIKFDADDMNLDIEAEFDVPNIVAGIIMAPFIPAVSGYKPPYISSLIIDDGKGMKQNAGSYQLSDRIYIPCLPQMAKKVEVRLIQSTPYPVLIGVPEKTYSISRLGIKYDPFTRELKQPEYKAGDGVIDESEIIEEYFVEPAKETLPALRYAIGLRQVAFLANTYVQESEYVSKKYTIANGIRSIQLDVDYVVPEALLNDKLVSVYISFDDGATWYELAGSDRDAQVFGLPRKIIFSSYTPNFVRKADTIYLTGPADSFRVKIYLKQPIDIEHSEYITPVVTGYMAIIEEAGSDFSWV